MAHSSPVCAPPTSATRAQANAHTHTIAVGLERARARARVLSFARMADLRNHHIIAESTKLDTSARTAAPYVLLDSGNNFPYAIHPDAVPKMQHLAMPLLGELYEVDDATLERLE